MRIIDWSSDVCSSDLAEWKTVAVDETSGDVVTPLGSIGFRWGDKGKWNLEERDGKGHDVSLALSLAERRDAVVGVDFPYFGSGPQSPYFTSTGHGHVLRPNVPVGPEESRLGKELCRTVDIRSTPEH